MAIIFTAVNIPRVCFQEHSEDYNQSYDAAPKAFDILESISSDCGAVLTLMVTHNKRLNNGGRPHSSLPIYLPC